MTPDEMLQIAQANTQNMDYKIDSIGSVLKQLMGDMRDISDELDQMLDYDQELQILVMTTKSEGIHGAAAMLNIKAMEQAKKILGCEELLVIPSSIHECLILGGNDAKITPDMLKDMIMDVNATQLAPEDILSDFPLKYSNGRLSLAIEPSKMDMAQETEPKIEHRMSI